MNLPNPFEASQIDHSQLLKNLQTSSTGLSERDVQAKQKAWGKNVLVEEVKKNIFFDFLKQFKNPLVLILLVASGISFSLGEHLDAAIVTIIILFSTLLNLFQEKKADQAMTKLKERLINIVNVIRDGKSVEIKVLEVTVGDILDLNAGDLIPADARIIEAKDFFVNQSALTGESFPSEKQAGKLQQEAQSIADLSNIAFSGTNVITGTARAVVIGIGKNTEFGKIASDLNQREVDTEFTLGIRTFSNLILRTTLFIVLTIFLFNIVLKRDLFESFMFAVAIAVGLTPELLPLILSVNMSSGSLKMAKKGVIVKKLVAIPDFGSLDVLCTDKTGTLTQDKISLNTYTDAEGVQSEKLLLYGYLNSSLQTGIANPLDEAVKQHKKMDTSPFQKVDEIPFDFFRKRMSVVVAEKGDNILICKGAPEEILSVCTTVEKKGQTTAITKPEHDSLVELYQDLSKQGFRVLALGYKKVAATKEVYEPAEENELTFLGYLAFSDPPKTDVSAVMQKIQRAGLKIKIITGDNELVTEKVCQDLGIKVEGVLFGHQIDALTDDALRVAVEKNNIFARFSPDEKNRIINALKLNGHIVGYMGDGINDAPSLKAADVGISVENAVDVARESADIILTKKDLGVLLEGILAGRVIFGNSMKYIMMGVSSNFGNMFSVIGAVLFLPYLPMLPIQILLNNLIYDCSQITIPNDTVDESYIEKPKRWNIQFVRRFMVTFGLVSSVFDFITFLILFQVFHSSAAQFQTGWFLESLATQTLIILIIRTRLVPFIQSRPAKSLLLSTILAVVLGWGLTYLSVGNWFGFVALPWNLLGILAGIVIAYLITVEVIKHWFYKKFSY